MLSNLWGLKVLDYKTLTKIDGEDRWVWKSLENVDIPQDDKVYLKKILKNHQFNKKNRAGRLICRASKDASYKVKIGYNLIFYSQRWESLNLPLKLCWDPTCLPKEGIFLWAVIQNRILIADRFTNMGYEGLSRCSLCKINLETSKHLLYSCPSTQECWE